MGKGLSPEQAMVLHAIGAPGPALPVRTLLAAVYPEAAAAGGADHAQAQAALSRTLRRLEARGLVLRYPRRAGATHNQTLIKLDADTPGPINYI